MRELSADPGLGLGLGMKPQELETQTMSALGAAASALQAKAPDELAGAAKGTSESETAVLTKIEAALG